MRRLLALTFGTLFVMLAEASVATAGGGCHGAGTVPAEASATVVKIDGCTFSPTVTRVPVGTTVVFENTSQAAHDVTGRMSQWGSQALGVGATFAQRFPGGGVYPYSCSLHPGMAGVVIVGTADLSLATDVKPAPIQATTVAASDVDTTLPIVAAGGLGILAGALVAGAIVSRRRGWLVTEEPAVRPG